MERAANARASSISSMNSGSSLRLAYSLGTTNMLTGLKKSRE